MKSSDTVDVDAHDVRGTRCERQNALEGKFVLGPWGSILVSRTCRATSTQLF